MGNFALKVALFAPTYPQIVRTDTCCCQLTGPTQTSCLSEQRMLRASISTPTCWSCDSMICSNQPFGASSYWIRGYSVYGALFCKGVWVDRCFSFLGNGSGVRAARLLSEKRIGDCSHNFVVWIHLCLLFLFLTDSIRAKLSSSCFFLFLYSFVLPALFCKLLN